MIYFYGGAFNPMTKTHLDIIKNILNEMKETDQLIVAITDHDYKTYDYDFNTRKQIVLENLKDIGFDYTLGGRFQVIKQDQRTWRFLHTIKIDDDLTLVVGEDEWNDLKAGKWHYSDKILNTYKIRIIPRTDDISATKVRELIKSNASKNELLKYITEITYKMLNKESDNKMKSVTISDMFKHGAIDLVLFALLFSMLNNRYSESIWVNIFSCLFQIGLCLFFIYDVWALGSKLEDYLKNKGNLND